MSIKKLAIGLMTGSSMDGIDGAILETDGKFYAKHIAGDSLDYQDGFKLALRLAEYALQKTSGDLLKASDNFPTYRSEFLSQKDQGKIITEFHLSSAEELTFALIEQLLTKKHAEIVHNLLDKTNLKSSEIEVIGFHGQNLYHNPPVTTIQIGDGQLLSKLTNITVVNNFRMNDVRSGGQGAPFAPLYHFALAHKKRLTPVAVLNCGGIANITLIYNDNPSDMIAFDTGPGNVLIDRYIRQVSENNEHMDKDGQYGKQGVVDYHMLDILKKQAIDFFGNSTTDGNLCVNAVLKSSSVTSFRRSLLANYPGDYFAKLPPKSLDTRHFNLPNEIFSLSKEDACATLEYFTAECIVSSLKLTSTKPPKRYIVAGGGWKNPVIYDALIKLLKQEVSVECEILNADDIGWSGQYMEAEIFAYLAIRNLNGDPISLPNITGAAKPTLSDNIYYSK